MKYCVTVIQPDENRLKQFEAFHNTFHTRIDDFRILIDAFVTQHKNNKAITEKRYLFNLLTNVNQIEYSFKEIKKAKQDLEKLIENEFNTKKKKPKQEFQYNIVAESSILVFFFNAKSFLELVRKHTRIRQDIAFNELLKDITFIRDNLAHSYEKDRGLEYLSTKSILVTYKVTLDDIEYLELDDIETGETIGHIQFSMDAFYFKIRDVFNELKDNPSLLTR